MNRKPPVEPSPYVEEVERLRAIYQKAERDIIEVLNYQRRNGLVDYATVAALERVQKILQGLVDEAWEYIPVLVEKQYMQGKAALEGYRNAAALTSTQRGMVDRLIIQLEGTIVQAAATANAAIQDAWSSAQRIARLSPDVYREAALRGVIAGEASGFGVRQARAVFLEEMKRNGIVGFVDKSGRKWQLSTYADMATRTTGRQATNLGALYADEEWDLYQISSHNSACPLCAPYEGRVYSRSGTHPVFPPLALAFGKIDPHGADTLDNSYLNIHPNCLHTLHRWEPDGHTAQEIQRAERFSSFTTNPPKVNLQSAKEREAYRRKEEGRRRLLDDYRQWQRYRLTLGDEVPKTFAAFQRNKLGDTERYQAWKKQYRQANQQSWKET